MKNICLLLLLILTAHISHGQKAGESRFLRPDAYKKKIIININKKQRTYYALHHQKPSIINIKGPGTLKVMTRGQFIPSQKDKIEYTIAYTIDGSEPKSKKHSGVIRSKKSTFVEGSMGVPGILKTFEIDLGRGYHTIELKLINDQVPVIAKYKFTAAKTKKIDWINYSPKGKTEPVELHSRESSVKYYRFSALQPLQVEIIGPSRVRVMTRIENHYNMKGEILYRIQVKENGQIVNTYQLSSTRSQITKYSEKTAMVPGKAREFIIDVPKGKHTYEIIPLDKDKSTILGRLLIPKTDINPQ